MLLYRKRRQSGQAAFRDPEVEPADSKRAIKRVVPERLHAERANGAFKAPGTLIE